jgi:hypothetical protein
LIKDNSDYSNIERTQFLQNQTEQKDGILNVAVKTCHPNVDVAYFKALLSEIKIMGYLGHHGNVVSMVGACTENIKDREFISFNSLNIPKISVLF